MNAITTRQPLYDSADGSLYASGMVKRVVLGIQDFRMRLKARVDALERGEETIVQKRGVIVGALVPIDWYRTMREQAGDPTDF